MAKKLKNLGEFVYKYRYFIALAIFCLCIVFEISGSSIGYWKDIVNSNVTDDGVILGVSRLIRGDEWSTLTPMMFSQKFDGFNYFSNIIRGGHTDTFIVYGLPILNIVQIFRPFQIGFLFLGLAKGLSFFWCGRIIALFLVTFELFMLLTKKNKLVSFLGAVMITLAPVIQWWFAVNGIAEIFIFGELAILLLHKYMVDNSLKKRCMYLALMIICAGGYFMVMYPAWQIPMFYVFLSLAIWVVVENKKVFKINYKDVISILISIIILGALLGYIFYNSFDTIKSVMNTAYPGERFEVGGGLANFYPNYIMDIFLPYKGRGLEMNACETSVMFSLFPIGIILSVYILFKENKKDLLLILFFVVYTFLSIWCISGFSKIISKITLMSNTMSRRAFLAVGYLDILMLIRSLSLMEKPISRKISVISSIIIAGSLVFLCQKYNKEYVTLKMCIIMFIMSLYLFYFAFTYKEKYAKYFFTFGMVCVMVVNGIIVNPIRKGVDVIYDSNIIKNMQDINSNESGKWISVGENSRATANYILMAGVVVINSTNVYPDLEKWQLIDKSKTFEEIYNRYAHVSLNITNDSLEKFVLDAPDAFTVNLLPEELKLLEVKYIFTQEELDEFNSAEINFEKIYEDYGYNIYKVNY